MIGPFILLTSVRHGDMMRTMEGMIMQAVKTTRITFRANAVLRGKLAEAAGDYGSLSNVVRVILERHFLKAALKGKA